MMTSAVDFAARVSRLFSDAVIVILLVAIAAAAGTLFVGKGKVTPQFYQREFAPAVALACGERARATGPAARSAVNEFLAVSRPSIACDEVPADIGDWPRNMFQDAHRYLMGAVGLLWRMTGVDWGVVKLLSGAMYAASAAFAYGLLRLAAGRLVATVAVLCLIFSALQLSNLPHLRDYSKAPFIFAAVFFLALSVRNSLDRARLAALAAASGLVLGVGLGFRLDLLLFVPFFPAVFFLFLPGGLLRNIPVKLAASTVFFALFLAASWPVLKAIGSGGNSFHVILLGLTTPFDAGLKIAPSIYEWGYRYNDTYIWEVVNSFAHRTMGAAAPFNLATAEYDRAGLQYYLQIATHFPADLYLRFGASVFIVLGLAAPSMAWSAELVPWIALAALLGLAVWRLRAALFAFALILFLCSYPSLQFSTRHLFHLQIVPIWILAMVASTVGATSWKLLRNLSIDGRPMAGITMPRIKDRIKSVLIFAVCAGLLPLGALFSLRTWQQGHLTSFLGTYASRAATPANFERQLGVEGDLTLRRPVTDRYGNLNHDYPIETRYWVVEFDSRRCDSDVVQFSVDYEAGDPFNDHSRRAVLPIFPGRAKYYFASYSNVGDAAGAHVFSGLTLDQEAVPCFVGISEVMDLRGLGLLPSLLFREDWQEESLYQRYRRSDERTEAKNSRDSVIHYSNANVPAARTRRILGSLATFSLDSAAWHDRAARTSSVGVTLTGAPESRYVYLMTFPEVKLRFPRVWVASGELRKGGLTFGQLENGKWLSQINITEPGKFAVALEAGNTTVTPTIASYLPEGQHSNDFDLHRVGWSEPSAEDYKARVIPVPEPGQWAAQDGVRKTHTPDGLVVNGNASRYGYQLVSAPVPIARQSMVALKVEYLNMAGRVCPGVLTENQQDWLVAPGNATSELRFNSGDNQKVSLVLANCNPAEANNPPSQFLLKNIQLLID